MADLEPLQKALRDATVTYVAAVREAENLLAGMAHFTRSDLERWDELKKAEKEALERYESAKTALLKARASSDRIL